MIYAFAQYELDKRVYELRHEGRERPVEPQVFDLLAYLLEHRDRVIPKEELLEKLWPDRFVSESTLTSRLKEARKAVGDTGRKQSIIRTHHGRGYRFVAAVEERGEPTEYSIGQGSLDERSEPDRGGTERSREVGSFKEPVNGSRAVYPDFVGREEEFRRLGLALEDAKRGSRHVVFITGEAGSGKTTLVEAFLARNWDSSILVARGQCLEYRGSGEAYMPLLDAFARLCRQAAGGQVLELLKREAPSWVVQNPSLVSDEELAALIARTGSSGERMLREFGAAIERLTEEVPLVLVLEDLHWSDYATLDVIDLLARQPQFARLLVVGTFRPTDMKAARHPVHAVSNELRVRNLCTILPLPLLVPRELEEYVSARFADASFCEELARVLHSRTSGNPLFTRNLVDSWVARGLIREKDGNWALQTPLRGLATDVPDSLQHLIEKQVSELDEGQQHLLETASVVGRSFPAAAVAEALSESDDDIERTCELLCRGGRFLRSLGVESWGDGTLTTRFAFIHDLYVDVVYDRIPLSRRARIHRQLGIVLERTWEGREREHASELALHFQRSRDSERGPRYLQLAAEQALARNAWREAVAHLTDALELLENVGADEARDRQELVIRCRLAPALVAIRGWADSTAESNYLRAEELARTYGEQDLLSQTLFGLASMYEYRGEYRKSERIVKDRIALDGEGSNRKAMESNMVLACSMIHQGRYQESVAHGLTALEAFHAEDKVDSDQVTIAVEALGWVSGALFFAGDIENALRRSDEALRLAEDRGDEFARASASIQAAFLYFYLGETNRCRQLAETCITIARERRFPFPFACGRILLGWCMAKDGQYAEAAFEIRAGIRMCTAIGARIDEPLFLAILADVLTWSGDASGAIAIIDEALLRVDQSRPFFYSPDLHRVRGHLLLETEGDREQALEELRRALAIAEEQASPVFTLRAASSLAQVDASEESRRRLRSVYGGFQQRQDMADLRDAAAVLG